MRRVFDDTHMQDAVDLIMDYVKTEKDFDEYTIPGVVRTLNDNVCFIKIANQVPKYDGCTYDIIWLDKEEEQICAKLALCYNVLEDELRCMIVNIDEDNVYAKFKIVNSGDKPVIIE